jgi:hypothetical protein
MHRRLRREGISQWRRATDAPRGADEIRAASEMKRQLANSQIETFALKK